MISTQINFHICDVFVFLEREIQKNHDLIEEIKDFINDAKETVAVTANSALTILYWDIGRRINNEILQNKRADYGQQIIRALSKKLTLKLDDD